MKPIGTGRYKPFAYLELINQACNGKARTDIAKIANGRIEPGPETPKDTYDFFALMQEFITTSKKGLTETTTFLRDPRAQILPMKLGLSVGGDIYKLRPEVELAIWLSSTATSEEREHFAKTNRIDKILEYIPMAAAFIAETQLVPRLDFALQGSSDSDRAWRATEALCTILTDIGVGSNTEVRRVAEDLASGFYGDHDS